MRHTLLMQGSVLYCNLWVCRVMKHAHENQFPFSLLSSLVRTRFKQSKTLSLAILPIHLWCLCVCVCACVCKYVCVCTWMCCAFVPLYAMCIYTITEHRVCDCVLVPHLWSSEWPKNISGNELSKACYWACWKKPMFLSQLDMHFLEEEAHLVPPHEP